MSDESKAYRLFDTVSQKIIISRDVIFKEEKNWDWEQHNKTSQHTALDWSKDTHKTIILRSRLNHMEQKIQDNKP